MNKLVLAFASVVLVILAFVVGKFFYFNNAPADASIDIEMSGVAVGKQHKNRAALFMGVREPKSSELLAVYPELSEQPMLVSFTSKYCLDCKKMKPLVDEIVSSSEGFLYKTYDIMDDAEQYPQVFKTFQPVSVPTLIFITQDGQIEEVLYNLQTKEAISVSLNALVEKAMAVPSAKADL